MSVTPDLFRGPPGREGWPEARTGPSPRSGPRNKSGVTKSVGRMRRAPPTDQNAALIENTTWLPAIVLPSLVEAKFGCR